jgi:murein DD-endopeptidase MepM/ murein hydrolase activator NlpD
LGSTSLADLASRLEIVDRAVHSDDELITSVQVLEADLDAKNTELQALKNELRDTRSRLSTDYEALEETLAAQQRAIDRLEADQAEADALVRKLEKKLKAEIEAEKRRLAALRDRPGQAGGGTVSGHPFEVCPVDGAVAYSDDFGAPRVGHLHAGNDVFAERGTPIVAPFDGEAVASDGGLGGLSVKVYGSAGWVYNTHLDSLGKLGRVTAGTVIGYVGNDGNAASTPPHDHFEWHPDTIPADPWVSRYGWSVISGAIDPYPYLNQVC